MTTMPMSPLLPKAEMRQIARAINRAGRTMLRVMHRAFVRHPSGAGRRRCRICCPKANPLPLCIDGHEYARRRRGRKGKR